MEGYAIFKLLGDSINYAILEKLASVPQATVTELHAQVRVQRKSVNFSIMSTHLHTLRDANLIDEIDEQGYYLTEPALVQTLLKIVEIVSEETQVLA